MVSNIIFSVGLPLFIKKYTATRTIPIDQVRNEPTQDTAKRIVELMSDQASHVRSALTRLIAKMPEEVIEATIEAQLQEQSTQRKRLGWEIALALTGPIGA
ncbi:MAG: hypothetical protein QGG40_05180, partial [Myxococcota bacterium]|nr:hypothetical protein [Myxococcota bacterium]